jgi:hypothetical protein
MKLEQNIEKERELISLAEDKQDLFDHCWYAPEI